MKFILTVSIFLSLISLFLQGCEKRIFLTKDPEIIIMDGRYVFDPAGAEYDRLILSGSEMIKELSSCREEEKQLSLFSVGLHGYYDLLTVSGKDTSLVNNIYLSKISENVLKITVLDVDQGDCFIIFPPDGKPSVIDGGYGSKGWLDWQGGGSAKLVDRLVEEDIFELKYLVETHHHADHYGGLYDIRDDGRFSYDYYLTYLSGSLAAGDTIHFSDTVKGVILHKGLINQDPGTHENDRSIVIRLFYHNFDMLFTGDIQNEAEEHIISSGYLEYSELFEILKVAHHGSTSSSSQEFLDITLPLYSIITTGEGNPYGHPSEDVVQRLLNLPSSVLRTDNKGTLEIFSDGLTFQISYYTVKPAKIMR